MDNTSTVAQALVVRGMAGQTAQAAGFVMEGLVLVNGLRLTNPHRLIRPDDRLELT